MRCQGTKFANSDAVPTPHDRSEKPSLLSSKQLARIEKAQKLANPDGDDGAHEDSVRLGGDIAAILMPPCELCMENH